jgi:hypothetical protein
MTIPSNLYADKIFSEHPISLYPLDDDVSYISLISDSKRLFNSGGWSASANNSASVAFNDNPSLPNLDSPFLSDIYSSFSASGISANNTTITIESPTIFNLENLNQDLTTFSLSLYLYQNSIKTNWYEVGYVYYDEFLSTDQEVITRVDSNEGSQWINFDFSYTPAGFYDSNVRIIIRVNVDDGGNPQDYDFIVNGISIGQWSENTSSKSLGVIPQSASVTTASVELFGVPAIEYGIQEKPGYYLSENNRLLAKNAGVPLIYSSENVTRLYPSASALPSLIIPGNGFLFESGKFKQFSAEFWMRINPDTLESRRIFGPLDTNDGLYVRDGVVSLVLGNSIGSHPVSEWYRPMLVHVLLKNDTAALYINGEQVIEIPLIINEIEFAQQNDWLGFYSYEDISNFEVDCFSLYSYLIPLPVAKKRFVWGQGTDAPQTVADFFDGTNTYINYSNANYTVNKTYPDTGNWQAGYRDNLLATRRSISSPNYSLPEIFIEDRNLQDLYDDNKIVCNSENELFFTFRPNQGTRTNLARNPSFETNTTLWGISGTGTTIARITSDSLFGSACLQVTKAAVANSGAIHAATSGSRIPVSPSTTYRISVYVKVPTGQATSGLRTRVIQYTAVTGGSTVSTTNGTTVTVTDTQGWVRLNQTITTGSTTNAISVPVVQTTAGTAGQLFLIDGLLVEQTSQLSPYFDGSYAEPEAKAISTFWEGTQNNSASNMTFRSETGLNWTDPGYLFFSSLGFVENISSIYGVFSLEDINSFSPVMLFRNTNTLDEVNIFVENGFLNYKLNQEILYSENLNQGDNFSAGININSFVKNFGYRVSQFFKSINDVQLYIGGNGQETFLGKIFSIGFSNKKNNEEIKSYFLESGIVDIIEHQDLLNHTATYTLSPLIRYNRFFLDISISAFWEEYFPLASFASFVRNIDGKKYYDLDYLQLNLGYPSITEIEQVTIPDVGWTYQELYNAFNSPIQKSYEILDNPFLTDYANYEDLNNNNITISFLNTENSSLRAYATFQLLAEGANQPIENFPYTKNLIDCCFIDAQQENTNVEPFKAYLTKFEFINNTVIFPPQSIDFRKVAIVIHFDIKQKGILSNPLRVRDFEIASRSLNQNEFNPIGTESGIPIYPYVKTGIYFDNKEKNPVLISKKRLPYLNLNQSSGIRVMGRQTFTKEFGIAMPINQEKQSSFSVGAMQFWMKYDPIQFPTVPYSIFEVEELGKTTEFVIRVDASGKRGTVVARDKRTRIIRNDLVYYQNGIRVKNPIVEFNSWESIGIEFDDPLIFDNIVGYFNIFRGPTFNNLSYFNVTGLGETSGILARNWLRVLTDDDISNFDWEYWYDENGSSEIKQWRDVYVVGETRSFIITPQDIYKSFVGTNRIIVDDGEAVFDSESVTVYSSLTRVSNNSIVRESDILWTRFSDIPA